MHLFYIENEGDLATDKGIVSLWNEAVHTLSAWLFSMTRFQLILPVHSQNVTKNLTGHRMHVAGPQIYQINRQTNSFQNIYGMQ